MNNDTHESNARAGYEAGLEAASLATRLDHVTEEEIPVVLLNSGQHLLVAMDVLKAADARAEAPRRLSGYSQHTELDSFLGHVRRHSDEHTVIFALYDQGSNHGGSMTAIYNYNEPQKARWSDHRAIYTCPWDEAWKAWQGVDGRELEQEAFVLFLEEHFDELVEPFRLDAPLSRLPLKYAEPLRMVEALRDLKFYESRRFERKLDRATGQRSLVITEGQDAGTQTTLPEAFVISLPVYRSGEPWALEVRVSFRIVDKSPMFKLQIHRRAEIAREAFQAMRLQVERVTELPVFAGVPER